ncbi:MAG: MiaB/RimO family radical SAM methylthiotransferase, partial [Clostridia bacterium]|nr:MiaB/RimO family radical SAM methylthiotransferase [Clostridia bacterium]
MSKKYFINTYGCQMNVHESEKLAGILANKGYEACGEESEADVVVFNTCCIRDTAERRALGNIGVIKGLKKEKPSLIVAVVGCMPQQEGVSESIREKYPYVDIVLGTRNIAMIADEIDKVLQSRENIKKRSDKKYRCFDCTLPEDYLSIDESTPTLRTSYPNAWVNIIYGCNNFCSYCIVPYVRGREISRDINSVLDEVKRCVDDGYKEITLLGQNVNSYGNDLNGEVNFAKLLHEIDKIEGKFRVRFMTSHPKDLTESV